MMNFLDLSAASEEECRLIREILSDTSVVNIAADPIESKLISSSATATSNNNSASASQAPKHDSTQVRSNLSQHQQPSHPIANQSSLKQGQNNKPHQQQQRQSSNFSRDFANQNVSSSSRSSSTGTNVSTKAQVDSVTTKPHSDIHKAAIISSQQQTSTSSIHHQTSEKPNTLTSSQQISNHPSTISVEGATTPDDSLSTSINNSTTTNASSNDNTENSPNGLGGSQNQEGTGSKVDLRASSNPKNEQSVDQHQPPAYAFQQHGSHAINGHKQSFRTNTIVSNTGPSSFSNTSNHGHLNNIVPVTATQNYRNNYNGQRKNVHNSGNISSISNNNRNRIPSSSNVSSVNNNVQPIYPQQFTPPLPSNASPSVQYHNINVNNMNGHNPNAISNQLSYRHPRASDHGSDRHGGMGNHIHGNNSINLVSTSSSAMPNMNPNIGQHHSNAMPINMYNQHATHLHHQVPPAMSGAKIDQKNGGNKNSAYHVQETSDSLQTASPGGQSSSPSGQMPQMAGDMNTVIGMDMTNAHPQGYAIQAFAPPHPHQMFSGPPIFQPHPYSYLIPYNLPPYVPYVPMPSNTVPPRHQVQPQTSQNSGTGHTSAHSRQSHNINQQSNTDHHHYEPHSSNNHTNDQHHTLQDDSQSAEGNGTVDSQSTGKGDVANMADGHKIAQGTTNTTPASQMSSSGNYSTENQATGPHNTLAGAHSEKPIHAIHSNRDTTSSRKVSPPAGKLRGPVPTIESDKAELSASKSSPDTHASSANGNKLPLSEGIQKDGRDMHSILTSRAIDDQKPPKSSIGAPIHDHSSPGVSQAHQESSNKSTNNLSKTPQSVVDGGCNRPQPEDMSQNLVDAKDTDVNQRSGGAWASNSSKSWADLFKRQESLATRSTEGDNENCTQWTENSDEEGKTHKLSRKSESAMKSTSAAASTKEQRSQELAKRAQDKMAHRVAMKVNSINLKHALPFLKPRGFINKGNGCYINATLQALIACPPFYNLMKEIGDLRAFRRENSCTPILDSFAELFLHFPPLDSGKKIKQTGSAEQKLSINSLQAEAIEPKCIYNVLGNIKSECLRGAQEDAEEFLSSVLNGLHEEMISLGEILHESNGQNNQQSDFEDSNDDNTNDDNLWREVGSKNRSLPIRIAKVVNTPIQEIFGGSLFSIRTAGRDRCGHRSPFFDLQLDISGDNVKSVQDAIKSFTSPEIIHDFYCSKTRQKLDAQRRTSLDQLPPILILHLKQFVYTQDFGLKKLMKKIEYPIDFELPESCLHEKNSADKNLLTSRSYKLLAVVYHDGKEAVKGHYLTDVYHIGSSQWIRCDDSNLKVIPSPRIENTDAPRTPYLLFYRRLNTLRAQSNNTNNNSNNNHDNKKKS